MNEPSATLPLAEYDRLKANSIQYEEPSKLVEQLSHDNKTMKKASPQFNEYRFHDFPGSQVVFDKFRIKVVIGIQERKTDLIFE